MQKTIYICDICGERTDTKPIRLAKYLVFQHFELGMLVNDDEMELCNNCMFAIHSTIDKLKAKAKEDA